MLAVRIVLCASSICLSREVGFFKDFSDIDWGISRFLCGNLDNESWQESAGEREKAVNFQCGTLVW